MRIKDVHEGSVLSRGPYQINQKEMQTESQNKAAGVLPPGHLSRPLGKSHENNPQGEADSFWTTHRLTLDNFSEASAEVIQLGSVPATLKLGIQYSVTCSTPPCAGEMFSIPSTFSHLFLHELNDLPTEYQRDVG